VENKNELLNILFKRRSIRNYEDKPVNQDKVEMILKAAMLAPSAGNAQPWHFIVVNNRNTLDKIAEKIPHAQMLKSAPMAIIVVGDTSLEKAQGFWVADCSAATQNILLAATAVELGSVWLGIYPRENKVSELRELLDIPENAIPLSIVAIGHPAEEKEEPFRYKEERIHHNKW